MGIFLRDQRLRSLRWYCPACYVRSERRYKGSCRLCGSRMLAVLLSDEYIRHTGPMVIALRKLYRTEMGEVLPDIWAGRPRKGPTRRYSRGKFKKVKLL